MTRAAGVLPGRSTRRFAIVRGAFLAGIVCWTAGRLWALQDGQAAFDLLGQVDVSGAPVFTQSGINNSQGATPNARGFRLAAGLALDPVAHRLFVSDAQNHRVLVFNLNAENGLEDRTADVVLGQPNFSANASGNTAHSMSGPWAVAVDSSRERLYVADAGNNRVLVFNVSSPTNGMDATAVLGQTGFGLSGATRTVDGMSDPEGLAYDADGRRLFVGDVGNRRVLVFDLAAVATGLSAAAVLGQSDFVSYTSAADQGHFVAPYGLSYDSKSRRLFVSDSVAHRILVFDAASVVNGEPAVGVLGQATFAGTSPGGPNRNRFNNPLGTAFDPASGSLFVVDEVNARVLVFDVNRLDDGEDAVGVLGQPDFLTSNLATSAAGVSDPVSCFFDVSSRRLWVGEGSPNCRVVVHQVFPFPSYAGPATVRAYPNPFRSTAGNSSVTIDRLPAGAAVKIHALDGREVRELMADAFGSLTWDAKDAGGTSVPSGVYCGLATSGGDTKTFKIVIQR